MTNKETVPNVQVDEDGGDGTASLKGIHTKKNEEGKTLE